MDRPIFKLSYRLVFLVLITFGSCLDSNSPTPSCLSMSERSKWNRSFHFNNQELRLKLEVTNRSSHWIVNYIFEILARERLGYQFIEFVKQDTDHPRLAISRLDCKDSNCYKLPDVHINLELWLSLGTITSSWVPHNRVIDNGPLGPTNRWAISSREEFMSQVSALTETQSYCRYKHGPTHSQIPLSQTAVQSECDLDICYASEFRNEFIRYFTGSEILSKEFAHFPNLHSSPPVMSIINWYPHGLGSFPLPSGLHFLGKKNNLNSTVIKTALDKIYHCSRQYSGTLSHIQNSKKSSFCQFESQQATKLSWAKLKSTVPLIYQLIDRMHFSQSEYEDLLKSANHLDPNSGQDLQSQYRDIACKWLRLSPTRWVSWTKGWNKKLNLTVAGLFAFYGKWVVSNLDHVAEQAINFVNHNPDYFSNTEYALTLDVRNLTCSQDVVLNDYFDLLTASKNRKIIGVIAALCSDSIEPVVEVANMRRQIVVSPTVESVRFAKRYQYPYFFRTVPSMTHVSLILIRLFSSWGWRRVAVFREDDHFFDPLIFQSNGIDLIADFVMKENQLTYVTVLQIPPADIVLNRRVGQGAFGMVYGGEAKRNGRWEAVAVKVIGNKATYEGKTDFLSEAKLMRSLDHRNVVRLVGICLYPKENHLYLIMEFMLNGDLKTYLLSRRVLAQQVPDHDGVCPATLTGMAIDIAEGLAYLHRKNLIHRDIACRNCLVGSDGIVKIGDFGLTREMNSSENEGYYRFTRNCELPIRWMSPEAVQFGVFSVHSDIWSYGIVLYEIITFGVFPYDGLGDVEVVERVKRKDFSIIEFLPLAARNTTISRLIYQCCQHQWQHRPASLDQIIAILRKNPDCVRPFLTNEPPKPNSTIDALRFQPGAGACIMSKNTLASGDPSPSNPVTCNTTSDGIHGYPISSSIRGVLSATGSLGGSGKSPLGHHSSDSFSENLSTSAFLSFLSEAPLQNLGRRRHKTADGSTTTCRYHGIRRGTSSSSCGHTFRSSEHSSGDRSTTEDQPHLASEILRFPNCQKLDSFSPKSTISFEERRLKNYSKTRHGKPSPIRKIFSKQTSIGDEHMELVLPKNPTDYRYVHDSLNQSFVTPISYPQDESKTRTSQGEIVYECEDFQNVQQDNSLAFLPCPNASDNQRSIPLSIAIS
ncbi:unnamed protein product [Schistosoma rodhaini]|uniref:Protein kinase domain-containing protein n=1 Tax=Schistosoma rodhaini TaxID=6188 RepID=A0AA85G205_9TREM|nr:unnamed protein product [Schistosoma rodhaini]